MGRANKASYSLYMGINTLSLCRACVYPMSGFLPSLSQVCVYSEPTRLRVYAKSDMGLSVSDSVTIVDVMSTGVIDLSSL